MPNKMIVNGQSLPHMPWEERPAGCKDIIWRYSENPIIERDIIPVANSVFNSAAVPFKDGFAGVFRCDDKMRESNIYRGFSSDGIHWELDETPIPFQADDPEILVSACRYDPRVCFIEDRYYITWCNGYHGPTIGMGYTFDFETFYAMENALLPYNRNGVLFPRKINGKYMLLSRPSDKTHTPFGDIFLSQSPDLQYWGGHRHVMSNGSGWQRTKIGAGPIPIETSEGWLIFYHGVINTCSGFVYSFGAAITDIDRPWEVKYRAKSYLFAPHAPYERIGDIPNVVFPCAALTDADTGRIAIYYGCADTVTGLAFCKVDEVIDFVKKDSK